MPVTDQTITAQGGVTPAPWYRTVTREQWNTLAAAQLGYTLDAMDFVLYLMAIKALMDAFGFNTAEAGLLASVGLIASAVGGLLFGMAADYFGRTRALMATILIYSLGTLGAATSQSFAQLMFWRVVVGVGMGGEWSSGAVLVSETWPAEHRGKAIGIMQSGWALGYILAPIYGHLAHSPWALMATGPLLGFFSHGYFSVFGAMLSELFETRVRATAQGFTYNVGRVLGGLAPYTIGAIAITRGLGPALALTSALFIAGALMVLTLPETRGRRIENEAPNE